MGFSNGDPRYRLDNLGIYFKRFRANTGKKLLNQTVMDLDTGKPMKLGRMFWVRYFLGYFVAGFAFLFTLGILIFMPFWDKRNQNIYDKISNALVVKTPTSVL